MNKAIKNLRTPEECLKFIKENCKNDTELEKEVRLKRYDLLVETYGYKNIVEKKLLTVLYTYEDALTKKNKKITHASRTWPMVKKYGIMKAAEKAVSRNFDPQGYKILMEMGLTTNTFESVIVQNPSYFEKEIVKKAADRIEETKQFEYLESLKG